MKILYSLPKICAVVLTLIFLVSCSNDDDDITPISTEDLTITELALISSDLSLLVEALGHADGNLAATLNGSGPFTVLAPTNAAFQALLNSNPEWNQISDIDSGVLEQVLLNHVISADVKSTDLAAAGSGYTRTNADGAGGLKMSLYFDTSSGVTFNGMSSVVTNGADIIAKNGTIHVIDAVITLPTIATHATANSNFSVLAGALTSDLVATLSDPDVTLTVLAPDNDAFAALSAVPTGDALVNTLLNHVVDGAVTAESLINSGSGYTNTLATGPGMNNLSLYFEAESDVMFNGMATVSESDIVASNGIIHAVDAVITLPTIATFATSNPALSTLVDALVYADTGMPTVPYINTVSDATAGPFTVFAPTNDAFVTLLGDLNVNALTDLSTATVDGVLAMHIVAGANVQSGDLTSGSVAVLSGESITADANAFTLTDNNNRVSNIVTSLVDIQATNGVVHVIDKVILPLQP